jgi:hypothetical protein
MTHGRDPGELAGDLDVNIRKDRSLNSLSKYCNVAQFVSFSPGADGNLVSQYSRLTGLAPNHIFRSPQEALSRLLALSPEGTINIRSYSPDSPRSREFVYGIAAADEALVVARRLAYARLFVIANETIDVADGGVSGVAQGDIIEFAPRCVEKPGVASLPRSMGLSILSKVYGFAPEISDMRDARFEFSIHPKPRGWKHSHTVVWEYEQTSGENPMPALTWPPFPMAAKADDLDGGRGRCRH